VPTALKISGGSYPTFRPGVSDYVTHCPRGQVRIAVFVADPVHLGIAGESRLARRHARIVRLRPGGKAVVTLRLDGMRRSRSYYVRCLPADFPEWRWRRSGSPAKPFYMVAPSLSQTALATDPGFVVIFDRNGVPVWWYRAPFPPMDAKVLPGGIVAFARFGGAAYTDAEHAAHYEIRTLSGRLIRLVETPEDVLDHHDLQPDGRGGFYLLSYPPREHVDLSPYGGPADATVVDSRIQRVNRAGDLIWSWNSKDHVSLAETDRWWPLVLSGGTSKPDASIEYDPVHINSVHPAGGKLIVSLRHTDAVYQIDVQTGEIDWKLGGTTTPQSLTVQGDPAASLPLGGPHDARQIGDGTITVYDNATFLDRPPRAVRYRIDAAAGTATLLEDIRDPRAVVSFCCGSARRGGDGSWLMSWGGIPLVSEVAADGRRTFRLTFEDRFSYRAVGVGRARLDIGRLRRAMDRMHRRG